MKNEEIDRHLNELWKRASGKEYIPEPAASTACYTESHMETVQFLRNNFAKAESEWKRLLEVKESSIRDLSAQLAETRAHVTELKQCCQEARERVINEELAAALSIGESGKMLEAQKRNHAREIKILTDVLERTRTEMTGLSGRLEALKGERDAWKDKFSGAAVVRADSKDAVAGLEHELGAAKEALKKALIELWAERRARADAEK